uniref:Integrase catalytic domain-containing protein n=1 Tax=Fundulus heteroclitus TaxID=8078 RepID=A0A3Q2T220_FUNHE
MALAVLDKIVRKCHNIERAFHYGICREREKRVIEECLRNLQRISDLLSADTHNALKNGLEELKVQLLTHVQAGNNEYSAARASSGNNQMQFLYCDQIDFLLAQGHTVKRMANIFGCSTSFLYKKSKALGVPIRGRLAAVTDEDLETNIRQLQSLYPNSGTEVCNLNIASELVICSTVVVQGINYFIIKLSRRVYHVPYPNSLWHIDGNMRLIRWGFLVHRGIDGCSRLVSFLNCSTDNRGSTVLFHFLKATGLYGLPSRVRSDHGGEDVQVALVMNLLQGIERRSHLTGESIHNQRIERLWRDVFLHVLEPFYSTFYNLEDSALLDPSNDVHKLSLHTVFLPEIQSQLEQFREAWNHHSLHTENNKTPTQIWTERMLANMGTNSTATNNVFGENSNTPETLEELLQQHGLRPLPTTDAEEVPSVVVEPPQTRLKHARKCVKCLSLFLLNLVILMTMHFLLVNINQ